MLPEMNSVFLAKASSSTCAPNPIPVNLLKDSLPAIQFSLSYIINFSILLDHPIIVQTCYFFPYLKKKKNFSPYIALQLLPISFWPFTEKLHKSVAHTHHLQFHFSNSLLSPFQSGCYFCHLTKTALPEVTDDFSLGDPKCSPLSPLSTWLTRIIWDWIIFLPPGNTCFCWPPALYTLLVLFHSLTSPS